MLANLDNEVIFKKAFTDKIVFTSFVKDVLGLDIVVDKIETEKQFKPRIGNINFKLDIFAESTDDRVVIEIQRIVYDDNFDRFLHYFMMSIAQLQRSYQTYKIDKVVYGIIVMTAPYSVKDKMGNVIKNEVLVSSFNPRDLKNNEVEVYNHRLVFLNAYHKDDETPAEIRDWLNLIYESIHHPQAPKINENKSAIKRAAGLINVDNLTPEERAAQKRVESTNAARITQINIAKEMGREIGREEEREIQEQKRQAEKFRLVLKLHKMGLDFQAIVSVSELPEDDVRRIIEKNT